MLLNSNECRVLVQIYTWSHLVCYLWRWRINLRSLFFIWSTSLEVRTHFTALLLREAVSSSWLFGFSLCDLTERTRLRDDEHPLVTRVLHGPCEKISKILITEADLGEEVTYDVRSHFYCGGSTCLHVLYRIGYIYTYMFSFSRNSEKCFDKNNWLLLNTCKPAGHLCSQPGFSDRR